MTVIVTDTGFAPDSFSGTWTAVEDLTPDTRALELGPEADPTEIAPRLDRVETLRIGFGSFADGRGFSIAKGLRRAGYKGRLRAWGHVLADQYAMARRSGFDEVEIDADLAARQPETQWLARANWQDHGYRARFTAPPSTAA